MALPERVAPSSEAARLRMRRTRQRETAPELRLRSALHAVGARFRVQRPPLPGMRRRADVVFPRERVAVFADGCFWHSCPEHATVPKANRRWWVAKLDANVRRDTDTDARLAAAGWAVVRVWEHEDPREAAARVFAVVQERRA